MIENAQSTLARLRAHARRSGLSHQLVMQLYCQEEFLRRLGRSAYATKLVLKGGLLLYALSNYEGRPTKDVDFLVSGLLGEPETIKRVVEEIASLPGKSFISFEAGEPRTISEHRRYHGVRVTLVARIANTRTPFHVDIGVGDVVVPRPQELLIPTQLDHDDPPVILAYSVDSLIAEKAECMVSLMALNSRMKDFWDIYYVANRYPLDARQLQEAIASTLQRRGTLLEKDTISRLHALARDPAVVARWRGFSKSLPSVLDFDEVLEVICTLLAPLFGAILREDEHFGEWSPVLRQWEGG